MGKISQEIFLRKSFDNAKRLKEKPDWGGGRYSFSPKIFWVIMIMLYFGNLKPASSSFFLLTFNESRCFCHKNRICFCRSAVTFHLPLQVCGVCSYAIPPSLASDPGDLLREAIFSLTSCPTPPAPAVRSFPCPSLHERLFSLLLLINTHFSFKKVIN